MKQLEQDRAIKYTATLNETKSLIKKIKKIGINPTEIELNIEKIEQEIAKDIKDSYKYFDNIIGKQFLNDNLINKYDNAINKLEKIINFLMSEYDQYHTIYNASLELELNLKNIDEENISKYITEVIGIMTRINYTSTKDYALEKNIVEKVYQLVYKILKMETIYTNNTLLLDTIKKDNIHISYISKYIKEDIKQMLDNFKEYQEVYQEILKVNKQSISDIVYLDRKLISLLTLINNEDLIKNKKDTFLLECTNLEEFNTKIALQDKRNKELVLSIEELKKLKSELSKKRLKKNIFYLGNLLCLTGASIGLYKIMDNLSYDSTYKTKFETYDTRDDKLDLEEVYEPKIENELTITEYLPWVEPGYFRENYTREIYTYHLSDIALQYDNVEEYLNNELAIENYTTDHNVVSQTETPEELYHENYYIINRVTQNLNDIKKEKDETMFELLYGVSQGILIIIDLVILIDRIIKISYKRSEQKDTKQKLKETKKLLIEQQNIRANLLNQYNTLYEELMNKYNNLPLAIHDNKKVKKRIKEINNLNLNKDYL